MTSSGATRSPTSSPSAAEATQAVRTTGAAPSSESIPPAADAAAAVPAGVASAEVRETARRLGTIVRHLVAYDDGGESLRAIDSHGLSFVQFKVLMELFVSDPGAAPYLQELAGSLGASTPSLSRAVDGLVGKGLVSRHEDPEDRRRRRIELTPAGRAVVDRFYLSRVARVIEFAASLTPGQRAAFDRATDDLIERDDLASIYEGLEGTIG